MKSGDPFGDIDSARGANVQVPSYRAPATPGFIDDAIYNSETPKSTEQDVTTSISMENCWSDYTAQHIKKNNAEQLAIRNKAFNFSKPNTDNSLPDFEASEPED